MQPREEAAQLVALWAPWETDRGMSRLREPGSLCGLSSPGCNIHEGGRGFNFRCGFLGGGGAHPCIYLRRCPAGAVLPDLRRGTAPQFDEAARWELQSLSMSTRAYRNVPSFGTLERSM